MLGYIGNLLGLGEEAALNAATPVAAASVEPTTQVVAPAGTVDPEQPVIAATKDGGSAIVNAGAVPPATPVVAPAGSVTPEQPVIPHDPASTAMKVAPFALAALVAWYLFKGRKGGKK